MAGAGGLRQAAPDSQKTSAPVPQAQLPDYRTGAGKSPAGNGLKRAGATRPAAGPTGYCVRMKLTKYTHSCVRLEREGNVLVLDPGSFSEVEEALAGASAVLITHEHADHLDRGRVLPQLSANPELVLYAPAALAAELRAALRAEAAENAHAAADRIIDVEPQTTFTAAGFEVRSFGGQHALIHPLVPLVANIGYLIDGRLYHPGDSFVIPNGLTVQTLLVPIHAPWSKVGEVIDFVIAAGAERAYPIHDALLNETGLSMAEGHVTRFGERYGTVYQHLSAGDSVQL